MVKDAALRSARSIVVSLIAVSVAALVAPAAAGAATRPAIRAASPRALPTPARSTRVSAGETPKASTATTELEDAAADVSTENGVSWWLVVGWDNLASEPSLQVGLERLVSSPSSGFEFHDWTFDVKSSTFTFNDKKGTLDSGTEASPVASVDLAFKTTSSKAATCTSGSETIYDGTLSGTVSLVTGLKGGGTVSGTYTFDVYTPEVVVDDGCVVSVDECTSELLADSGNTSGPAVFAGTFSLVSTTENFVGIGEETDLSSPSGATREDVVALLDKKGKVYATYTGSEVKMASTGIVSGSGTVSGGKPEKEPPETCKYDGKKYKLTEVVDDPADYSGKFSATPSIGTTLKAPASTKTGLYLVVTSKKT